MFPASPAEIAERAIPTTIPWWMGVAMVVVWMALVAGMLMIVRRRWRTRRPVAQPGGSSTRSPEEISSPVRALPSGSPVRALPSGVSPRDRGGSASRPPEAGR